MKKVFDAQATNGNSAAIQWNGGQGKLEAAGTWGSGTLKVQTSPDNSQWIDVGINAQLTTDGQCLFWAEPLEWVRLALSGATGPDLDAWIGGGGY